MGQAVRNYIDAVDPAHRPLFDRMHRLIMAACPDAEVVLSYQMPTCKAGRRRLYVGAWRHGISLYGRKQGGFAARHPELLSGKATIRLRPRGAEAPTDADLLGLVSAALGP